MDHLLPNTVFSFAFCAVCRNASQQLQVTSSVCLLSNSGPDTDLVRSWRLFLMFCCDPYNLKDFLRFHCILSGGSLGGLFADCFWSHPVPANLHVFCGCARFLPCFVTSSCFCRSACALTLPVQYCCSLNLLDAIYIWLQTRITVSRAVHVVGIPAAPLHIGMPCSVLSCCLEPLGCFTDMAKTQQKGHSFSGTCVGVPGQWKEVIAQLLSCVCLCPACCAITLLPGI